MNNNRNPTTDLYPYSLVTQALAAALKDHHPQLIKFLDRNYASRHVYIAENMYDQVMAFDGFAYNFIIDPRLRAGEFQPQEIYFHGMRQKNLLFYIHTIDLVSQLSPLNN